MEQAIQLFGYLILTLLGFVFPVIVILLSVFHEGILKLAEQSGYERSQSEDNIRDQLAKLAKAKTTDEAAILESLKKLKAIKKNAVAKLSYLDPKKSIIRLFVPLALALLGVIVTFLFIETNIYYSLFLLVSITGFSYAIFILWKLIGIIIEVKKSIDTEKRNMEIGAMELLSSIAEGIKKPSDYYLEKAYVQLDGQDIKDDSHVITGHSNTRMELKFGVINYEMRMAKNLEVGAIFPLSYIIDESKYESIYRGGAEQIVRYSEDFLHGHTTLTYDTLAITPLESGDHQIRTFLKAENIEAKYKRFTIKVA